MSEHNERKRATSEQAHLWGMVHAVCVTFHKLDGPAAAASCGVAEKSASDALCVLHAMAHAWAGALGLPGWPDCELGDGAGVLYQQGFLVEVVVNI